SGENATPLTGRPVAASQSRTVPSAAGCWASRAFVVSRRGRMAVSHQGPNARSMYPKPKAVDAAHTAMPQAIRARVRPNHRPTRVPTAPSRTGHAPGRGGSPRPDGTRPGRRGVGKPERVERWVATANGLYVPAV